MVVIVMELLWSDIPHDPRRGEPRAENVGDGVDWEEKTNPANLRMVLVWYVGYITWHCMVLWCYVGGMVMLWCFVRLGREGQSGKPGKTSIFSITSFSLRCLRLRVLLAVLFQWHWTYMVATMSYLHTLQKHVPLSETWQAFIPANDTKTSNIRVCQKMINEVDKISLD